MRAFTFGPPVFETEIARIEPDAEVLFAILLYAAGSDPRGVGRDELASVVWPAAGVEQGRHSLRQALYRLRQLGVPIHLKAGQVAIDENDTEIDLRELMYGPIDRRELVRIGTQNFLQGYRSNLSGRYQAWVDELRERANSVRRRALGAAISDARGRARFAEIPDLARALLALDPLNETATLCLAEALVTEGSKVEALQLLDRYEEEVGEVSEALRIPARTLRRRVSEGMDDSLLPMRFEIPFVGRTREYGELREAWGAVRRSRCECIVVTGEPGIGKTRTSTELLRLAVLDGGSVVTYTCGAGDTVAPLSSLLGLTGSLLSQPGALGCGGEHLSYLRRLLNPDPAQPIVGSGMTADLAYAQLVYSLSELVAAIAEEAPLVVFIDDAHRLHETSWRIFTDVANRLPERSLLLLLTARQLPEFFPSLGITRMDGRARHIRLEPFVVEDAREFLTTWSLRNEVPLEEPVVERFAEAAAGNPFYLGELAAHRGRGGDLGDYPEPIRSLVGIQVAGLRDNAQHVLLAVSLLLPYASLQRVQEVTDLTPAVFTRALDDLERAGLISSSSTSLRLRHAAVGDIVHSLVSTSVLAFMRCRVAQILELDFAASSDAELLGHAIEQWHALREPGRAGAAAQALGDRLMSLGLAHDASEAFTLAHALAPTTDRRRSTFGRLLQSLYSAHNWQRIRELSTEDVTFDHDTRHSYAVLREAADYYFSLRLPRREVLSEVLRDTELPQVLRDRAALLALTAWDESLRTWETPAPLETLWRSCVHSTSSEARSVRLIIAAAQGDREQVVALVRAGAGLQQNDPALGVRELRHAAHALIRIGEAADAHHKLATAADLASELRLEHHARVALVAQVQVATHLFALESVAGAAARLAAAAADNPNAQSAMASAWASAHLAFLSGEESHARRAADELAEAPDNGSHVMRAAERAGLQLLLGDHAKLLSAEELLPWLRSDAVGLLARGSMDHIAVAATVYLASHGCAQDAAAFWRHYSESLRREARDVAPSLRERLSPFLPTTY